MELTCASTAVCLVAFAGISARSICFNDGICLGVEAPALREEKLQNDSSQVGKSQPLFPLLPLRACLVAADADTKLQRSSCLHRPGAMLLVLCC